MKIYITISLLLYFFTSGTTEIKSSNFPLHLKEYSKVLGKLLDSFRFECDKFADCVCAEAVRVSVKPSLKPLVIFISCYSRDARPLLQKDSVYLFGLTTDFPKGTLFHDPYDTIILDRRYWCKNIELVN